MIHLIDLCPTIQTSVDWQKVADSGIRGVIIKASQYSGTRIWKFREYASSARAVGLAVGAYHFAYVGADPIKQARFFFQCAEAIGSQPGDIPPILDLEFAQPQVSGKEIVAWGEAFLPEAERLWFPDNRLLSPADYRYRKPLVYMYPYFIQRCMPALGASTLVNWPLHIASYKAVNGKLVGWEPTEKDRPLIPNGTWKDWAIWQYSGNNGIKVPGIPMDCDRDLFNGDYDAWNRFLGNPPKTHGGVGGTAASYTAYL